MITASSHTTYMGQVRLRGLHPRRLGLRISRYLVRESVWTLGGPVAFANALNNSIQVVGSSQTAGGALDAFLYSGGSMQDLNLLIPPLSGITIKGAVGIDAAGDIVAYGSDASGQSHEYLLTPADSPVPEPSSLAVMTLAIAALAVRQVRHARRGDRRPSPKSQTLCRILSGSQNGSSPATIEQIRPSNRDRFRKESGNGGNSLVEP